MKRLKYDLHEQVLVVSDTWPSEWYLLWNRIHGPVQSQCLDKINGQIR